MLPFGPKYSCHFRRWSKLRPSKKKLKQTNQVQRKKNKQIEILSVAIKRTGKQTKKKEKHEKPKKKKTNLLVGDC